MLPWWGWILAAGLLWITVQWMWYSGTEGFTDLPWSQGAMDQSVRAENSCAVLERFPDTEMADAVIEIVDDTCEEGLPHTSDANTIRMTRGVWNSSAARRANVLAHERVHLMQRRNPTAWAAFYATKWQYVLSASPPDGFPADMLDKIRGNPDTFPERWAIWKGRYWFIPLYSEHAPSLRNAIPRVWDAEMRTWTESPPEWRAYFGKPGQFEHPHEISAEILADNVQNTPASVDLRNFILNTF